jgi:hypothetical protein
VHELIDANYPRRDLGGSQLEKLWVVGTARAVDELVPSDLHSSRAVVRNSLSLPRTCMTISSEQGKPLLLLVISCAASLGTDSVGDASAITLQIWKYCTLHPDVARS